MSATIQSIADATVIAGPPNASSALTAALRGHSAEAAEAIGALARSEHPEPFDVAAAVTVARWFFAAGEPWADAMLAVFESQLVGFIDDIFAHAPTASPSPSDPPVLPTPADPPTPQVGETYGDFKNRTGQIVSGPDGEIGAAFHFDGTAWVP